MNEQMYTQEELVKFGNYLLSKKRKDNFFKGNHRKSLLKEVNDVDLANWK